MTKTNPFSLEFVSLFNKLEPGRERLSVFKDFVELTAATLHAPFIGIEASEETFSNISARYSYDDLRCLSKLLALICAALDAQKGDFLGEIFNLLGLGDSRHELQFRPYEVAHSLASDMFYNLDELMKQQPYLTLMEMSCGAGGMAIARAEVFKQKGYNVHNQLYIQCVDVNPVFTAMCYIQLTILGVPAEVLTFNSRRLDERMVRYTPAFYAFGWMQRLNGEKSHFQF